MQEETGRKKLPGSPQGLSALLRWGEEVLLIEGGGATRNANLLGALPAREGTTPSREGTVSGAPFVRENVPSLPLEYANI